MIGSGPDKPARFYTIATMIFKNQSVMDLALHGVGPIIENTPSNTDTKPVMFDRRLLSRSRYFCFD